jgi:hypothetical protein
MESRAARSRICKALVGKKKLRREMTGSVANADYVLFVQWLSLSTFYVQLG